MAAAHRTSRLAAEVAEDDEPSDDVQHRKREETNRAGIWGHFHLTAIRIGRSGRYSAFSLLNDLRIQGLLSRPGADFPLLAMSKPQSR